MVPNDTTTEILRCFLCVYKREKIAIELSLGFSFVCRLVEAWNFTMSPSTSNGRSKCQTTSIPTAKNAERERSRVRSLRSAFQSLQACLPSVPPDTKLSKLDILILATNYISQLMATLDTSASPEDERNGSESFKFTSTKQDGLPDASKLSTVALPSSSLIQSYYHPMKVKFILCLVFLINVCLEMANAISSLLASPCH